jgi:hypothetical protein
MADPKLLAVAERATNMPDQFGTLEYTTQVNLLSKKIMMSNFQSGAFVDKFVGRYLAITGATNATSTDTTGALSILTGSGSSTNMLSALTPATQNATGTSLLSLFA